LAWSAGLDGVFGVHGLAPSADGRILLGGAHVLSPWVAKVDLDGNLLWSKVYAPSVYNVRGFARTPGGKAVLVGSTNVEGSNFDEFALAVDDEGNALWGASYDGGAEATEVRPSPDGVVVAGLTASQSGADNAGHVMRLSEDGAVVWNRRLGGSVSFLYTLDATPEGFVTAGLGPVGLPVVRLSPAGEVVSSHVLYDRTQTLLEFSARAVRALPGGGFALAGARNFGAAADGLLAAVGGDDVVRFASSFGGPQEDTFGLLLPVDRGLVALGGSKSLGDRALAVGLRTTASGLGELAGFARAALTLSYDPDGTTIEPGVELPTLESDAPAVQRTPIAFAVDPAGDAATQGQATLSWTKR
ncbi:MAG TPA: hypothetical protein VFS00_02370, partial [Polyangiaceae bacterium]|nr:hypothetical protein [Polyangiaceae bacterium]